MKYKYLLIRSLNLILIAGLLAGYQFTLYLRARRKEVQELKTQVDQLQKERNEFLKRFVSEEDSEADTTADQEASSAKDQIVYRDGTYEGLGKGFGGDIEVSVIIENGSIAAIDIVSAEGEDEAYFQAGKEIVQTIIDEQSADVDSVSGATFSSTGIKNAVSEALKKAEK